MSKKILIVDDDSSTGVVFSTVLQTSGYNTDWASDGIKALYKIDQNHYDLIISDIFMPNLNGLDLLKIIMEKHPTKKVIMITSGTDQQLREISMKGGAITFLEKPIEAHTLIKTVKDIFSQEAADETASEVSLFDLIQFLALTKKNKLLDIRYGENHGQIYIHNGAIVHAITKTGFGENALYECLQWKNCSFKDFEYREPKRQTIEKPVDQLLLEAAKIAEGTSDFKPGKEPDPKPGKEENTTNDPHSMLLLLKSIGGIQSLAWLDEKGVFLVGEGPNTDILRSFPKFILSTESQIKKFHDFPQMNMFCLTSTDGKKILTFKIDHRYLTVLIKSGYEVELIQETIIQMLKTKSQGSF